MCAVKATRKAQPRSQRNGQWIEQYLFVPEGKLVGRPFKLSDEQWEWLEQIYDSPTRQVIISMGRKNGKTAFSAALVLLHLVGPEAVPNSQLYSAARSRDQAALLFSLALKMVRLSRELLEYVSIKDSAKELLCEELGTIYKALSADAPTKMGLSPVFVVHDELGQVEGASDALYDALETASGAHDAPMSVVISTQAATDAALLSQLIDDALTKSDPELKLILYTAPEELDPYSEEAIKTANPHYGIFMNPKEALRQAETARRLPSAENRYRNLILNQRIDVNDPLIPRSVWIENGQKPDLTAFLGDKVYAGLDLSIRRDLTALVLAAKSKDNVWHFICHFFAPENGLMERVRKDKAPYDQWARDGFLTLTPGNVIDYDLVAEQLSLLAKQYKIAGIAYDRYRIRDLKASLSKINCELPLVEFGQGFKSMAPALDVFEAMMLNTRIRHGNNPILRMCSVNAVVSRDPSGNRKLDKAKARGRIDGLVAMVMAAALGEADVDAKKSEPQLFFLG